MMTEPLRTLRTVFSVYRSHCGLLWRIMLPVAIIAIPAYLLTGWIISVIDSVLMGVILWGFSLFISDLAAIQVALSPLKFLRLFIGADIQILLPQLLSTPVMIAILGIDVLMKTFLLPIWAILTTYLYLERCGVQSEVPMDSATAK